jgi:hypothetical protein
MGLDSFAMIEDRQMDGKLFEHLPPVLCGGMFSDGNSSIRGKVYNQVIESTTGISLYQEKIPNSQVAMIAMALEDAGHEGSGIPKKEYNTLIEWFKIIHNNGGYVVGWW